MVGETGLEPATSSMSTKCSNQLSYSPETGCSVGVANSRMPDEHGSPALMSRDQRLTFALRCVEHEQAPARDQDESDGARRPFGRRAP